METFKLSRNDWMLFNNLKEAIKSFTEVLKETNKQLKSLAGEIRRGGKF